LDLQPFVIFGGFMSSASIYRDLRRDLGALSGQAVWVVPTQPADWLLSVYKTGWGRLLRKLDESVRRATLNSSTGKITLIGHSAGGVLARLYLSDQPFLGHVYRGLERVDHLITLGSPHLNQGGLMRGGNTSRWVERVVPGAYYAPDVRYTCVAGKWLRGTRFGPRLARFVYDLYDEIGGDGTAWGDGIVPVESALLPGAQAIVLEGVSHFSAIAEPWYGSQEIIRLWLNGTNSQLNERALKVFATEGGAE
jgi:pimeloyl-ACP methyl ester carboxylesterase